MVKISNRWVRIYKSNFSYMTQDVFDHINGFTDHLHVVAVYCHQVTVKICETASLWALLLLASQTTVLICVKPALFSFIFFYHSGANLLVSKTSGPIEVYEKTALGLDLHKHFPDEFMGSIFHFRSCCCK